MTYEKYPSETISQILHISQSYNQVERVFLLPSV